MSYNEGMQGYFWESLLVVNSVLWFLGIAFLTYGTGMLILRLDWKLFLLALSTFVIVTLVELVLTGLAHN